MGAVEIYCNWDIDQGFQVCLQSISTKILVCGVCLPPKLWDISPCIIHIHLLPLGAHSLKALKEFLEWLDPSVKLGHRGRYQPHPGFRGPRTPSVPGMPKKRVSAACLLSCSCCESAAPERPLLNKKKQHPHPSLNCGAQNALEEIPFNPWTVDWFQDLVWPETIPGSYKGLESRGSQLLQTSLCMVGPTIRCMLICIYLYIYMLCIK